jgi:anaerobic magnesium-protoporphyrin IX monomethyl ester cyclase
MKKIMFIIPPCFDVEDYNTDIHNKAPVFTVPYGTLSILAYLKKNSKETVDVKILDLNLELYKTYDNGENIFTEIKSLIKKELGEFNADVIGIAALFNLCYPYLKVISEVAREVSENIPIVIGGGIATNLYKEVLNDFPCIDAACYAEGEKPVCSLFNTNNIYTYLEECDAGWITRGKLNRGWIPKADYVEDLDEIPFFDYNIIDINQYQGRSFSVMCRKNHNRELSIHTSRGCPFNCVFCANGSVHGKVIRYMSVERVVQDITKMVTEYNVNVLLIEDDHFLSDKIRAKKILEAISTLKIRLEFPNGLAVYAIDDEIASLLKKAGTVTATLAVESGSNYVLKNVINKPLQTWMVEKAVNCLRNEGINVHGFFVVGLPGELEIHRQETLNLMKSVGFDWVYPFIAIPIAGSRLYSLCKKNNWLINEEFSRCIMTKGNIKTFEIDPNEIEEIVYTMNLAVNFIHNYNFRKGDYRKAIEYWKPIADRYPEHAFVHFSLYEAYKNLGESRDIINMHYDKFIEIINKNSIWKEYAIKFNLI